MLAKTEYVATIMSVDDFTTDVCMIYILIVIIIIIIIIIILMKIIMIKKYIRSKGALQLSMIYVMYCGKTIIALKISISK